MHDRTRSGGGKLIGGVAIGAAMLGTASLAPLGARAKTEHAATPTWVTTQGKVVHLTLIAGYNNANAGFNFDGGARGRMVVTVPLGDKVVATYKNAASTPHDVLVVPYQKTLPTHSVPTAFAGASYGVPQFGSNGRPGARPRAAHRARAVHIRPPTRPIPSRSWPTRPAPI